MANWSSIADETFSLASQLIADQEGWTVVNEADGVLLESKPRQGSYINCYRVQGLVDKTPQEGAEWMWKWRLGEWQKFTPDLQEVTVVEQVNENQRLLYQRSSLPWPLWHRDVCMLSTKMEKNGVYYLLYKSVVDEKVPERPKEFVRATVLIGCYAFEAHEGRTKITRVIHLEPNGNIPSSIVNMKAVELHTTFKTLQKMFKEE